MLKYVYFKINALNYILQDRFYYITARKGNEGEKNLAGSNFCTAGLVIYTGWFIWNGNLFVSVTEKC